MFYKKDGLKNFAKFTGKHLCQSFFYQACNFIKKETLAQVFSCEFYEIFKNTYFEEHLRTTASGFWCLFFYRLQKSKNHKLHTIKFFY